LVASWDPQVARRNIELLIGAVDIVVTQVPAFLE